MATRRNLLLWALLCVQAASSCGDTEHDAPSAASKPVFDVPTQPHPKSATDDETDRLDELGRRDPPPRTTPFRGPCAIHWTTGAHLKFTYTDQGGTVSLDEEGDGTDDLCGSFVTGAAGQVARVDVAHNCDGKTDLTLAVEPDDASNVARAIYKEGGKRREVTLVTLPHVLGIDPGYTISAKKRAVKLSVKDGLVRSASVRKPTEGPPLRATFDYDAAGRIKRIKEDQGRDGTIDRQFEYTFDALGNLTKIAVVMGADPHQARRGVANIDYGCWQ